MDLANEEKKVMGEWTVGGRRAYVAFRQQFTRIDQIRIVPHKIRISFYKQTEQGEVFICHFEAIKDPAEIWLRRDSLASAFDSRKAFSALIVKRPPGVKIADFENDFGLKFTINEHTALQLGELIANEIASRI